ncbi:hypothetical protein EGW08_010470 [Elysia chlorotica]|uniref:Endonuclease/exonuclease/phosphatase domain-containing protein n=1 Tax=Elysia chlorotica TaxID=188477 RepID=A0A433TJN7_ELYCH|nr:hypothetical protein EGW08_010470 [Elysia chlorotica]
MDRERAHKGGVLLLVRNSIPAKDFQVDTKEQSEIQAVKITVEDTEITIHNLYCPQDKELSLHCMDIASENSIVVGDFNSHSTCWGYDHTDRRGDEVEDWQIDNALSVLQALKSSKNKDLNDLTSALTSLSQTHTIALQWIPSHCNVFGNETADLLAKKAAALQQNDYTTTYSEAKTIIHAQQHEEWLQEHPNHVQNDAYHALTRAEQVVIFRLRTGHNRLNHHLYTKLHIGTSDQCTCQTGGQTVIHVLQHCPMYENLRNLMWPQDTPMAQKLYGSLDSQQHSCQRLGCPFE